MSSRVVLGEVIHPIQTDLAPKNVKLPLPHVVANPIEMHVKWLWSIFVACRGHFAWFCVA